MTLPRLHQQSLQYLNPGVLRPGYDRQARKTGIFHLGMGNFHRAHQAVYTDAVLAGTGGDWMIAGANLFNPATGNRLSAQSGLYSILVRDGSESRIQVIGAIREVFFAKDDPAALIDAMSDRNIRIISLTITEKGYFVPDHEIPDDTPVSAPGYLVAALQRRRERGYGPLTLLSCDNLVGNGDVLRQSILELADRKDSRLANWIDTNVSFPNSMVDRIVPAPSEDLVQEAESLLGVRDEACLGTERFSQWVIEDTFSAGRPAWEEAGVVFSPEVHRYEAMKLRLLNGAHSAIACLGLLAGKSTVAEVMADGEICRFVADLMRAEISPEVIAPEGTTTGDYIDMLHTRFRNHHLNHPCRQIAMDGSRKLAQRLFPVASERLGKGKDIDRICLVIAAWMLYTRGVDARGDPAEVVDPLSEVLKSMADQYHRSPELWVGKLLHETDVFPDALATSMRFRMTLAGHLKRLLSQGVRKTLTDYQPVA